MSTDLIYHVVPFEDRFWAVRQQGRPHIVGFSRNKQDALAQGKSLARVRFARLVIHAANGAFEKVMDFTKSPRIDNALLNRLLD